MSALPIGVGTLALLWALALPAVPPASAVGVPTDAQIRAAAEAFFRETWEQNPNLVFEGLSISDRRVYKMHRPPRAPDGIIYPDTGTALEEQNNWKAEDNWLANLVYSVSYTRAIATGLPSTLAEKNARPGPRNPEYRSAHLQWQPSDRNGQRFNQPEFVADSTVDADSSAAEKRATASLKSTETGSGNERGFVPGESSDWILKLDNAVAAPILSCTYKLGHELPLLVTDARPVALRLRIAVTEAYRSRFSITQLTFGARNPEQGRFAIVMDDSDGFYLYAQSEQDLFRSVPEGAKELIFDVPYANFGTKPSLLLPKSLTARLWVTLVEGAATRVEKLDVPIRIDELFTAASIRSHAQGAPTLKGTELSRTQPMKGSSGDELIIPPQASVQVKFLDGTAVVYYNRDDVKWTLTMGAGKLRSTDTSKFLDNAYEINALINQGLDSGAESAADAARDKGLEVLLRKVASQSSPGLVIQISQFFGAARLGGEKVAVRLRSQVGVSLHRSGRIVVRNFSGTPEILRPGMPPLSIPEGFQAVVARDGEIQPVEPYLAGHPSVLVWSGDIETLVPDASSADRGDHTSRFGAFLGTRLNVREDAGANVYIGTWTRRDGTDVFDAIWNGVIRDVIEIEAINGNQIVFFRQGNNGRYFGTLSPDHRQISAGTTNWYAPDWSWSATVSGRIESPPGVPAADRE